jgi:DNA polymerase-1
MTEPRMPGPGDTVFLVDGSSFVFRAYFQSMNQDRKYNYRADGLPTGAVRLFCNKIYQFIREGAADVMPTHLAIIFDKSEKSFRTEIYPEYKANRSAPPDDLVPQFPLMRAAVEAFGLTPLEKEGFEADDLIATYARQATECGADVVIVSADKDLMQLVNEHVTMYDPASGEGRRPGQGKMGVRAERRIGVPEVVEYFGVTPDKVVDVQALVGDSTDNVPGVPGIGKKTAAELINEWGDLDTVLANAHEIRQPKRRESLIENAEQARLSRTLVRLDTNVEVPEPLEALTLQPVEPVPLIAFFKAMDFGTLTRRVAEDFGTDHGAVRPDPRYLTIGTAPEARAHDEPVAGEAGAPRTPETLAAEMEAALKETVFDRAAYETVTTVERLVDWLAAAAATGALGIAVRTVDGPPMRSPIAGIGLAVAPGHAAYVPLVDPAADLMARVSGATSASSPTRPTPAPGCTTSRGCRSASSATPRSTTAT